MRQNGEMPASALLLIRLALTLLVVVVSWRFGLRGVGALLLLLVILVVLLTGFRSNRDLQE